MALHKTEGVILSSADWAESSQTITVFTPDCGKIALTIKGSKKINGKQGRALKFARLEFSCYIRGDKASGYLSDVDPVEVFMFDKDGQLGRLTFASAALEMLNNLLDDGAPQAVCYQITLSFLRMVDSIEKKRLPGLFAGYILRVVSLLGFRPNLIGCAGCGKDIRDTITDESEDRVFLLSVERGGVVCADCRRDMPGENDLIGLKPQFHGKLLRLMEASLVEASKIPISLSDLNLLVDILTSLLKFHAGTMKKLKSFDFLDKLSKAVKTYGG